MYVFHSPCAFVLCHIDEHSRIILRFLYLLPNFCGLCIPTSGFGSTEAVDIAHNALAISKACPDAHNLLALYHAPDLMTALACYEAAEAAALQALAAGDDLVEVLSQSSVLVSGCVGLH